MDEPLRVMSFNVRYGENDRDENAWEHRRGMVASVLRFHRPAVVGLQEPLDYQIDDLEAELDGVEWIGRGVRAGVEEGELNVIGVRTERVARRDHGTFWLSETPDEPGSISWGADHHRAVTWADLRDRRTGATVLFATTHFDVAGPEVREESARVLHRRLASLAGDRPAVVVGDFNCTPGTKAYRLLVDPDADLPLRDAQSVSRAPHHGPRATFNGFDRVTDDPERNIDHVLVSDGITVHRHGVLTDAWDDGRFPSDHFPLLAELTVE